MRSGDTLLSSTEVVKPPKDTLRWEQQPAPPACARDVSSGSTRHARPALNSEFDSKLSSCHDDAPSRAYAAAGSRKWNLSAFVSRSRVSAIRAPASKKHSAKAWPCPTTSVVVSLHSSQRAVAIRAPRLNTTAAPGCKTSLPLNGSPSDGTTCTRCPNTVPDSMPSPARPAPARLPVPCMPWARGHGSGGGRLGGWVR